MVNAPRLFLSYMFGKENKNIVDVFKEVAVAEKFEVITGDPPAAQTPPKLIRSRILGCDLFAALITSHDQGKRTSAWISNEIGMAYAIDLPLLICKEASVEDVGLAAMATSYLMFDKNDLKSFRDSLRTFLREARTARRPNGRTLGEFIQTLTEEAVAGRLKRDLPAGIKDQLVTAITTIVKEYRLHNFAFGESIDFGQKLEQHLAEKRRIAKYVIEHVLSPFDGQTKSWVFMDSGTVTYTICEEIVSRAMRVPVMTNNLGGCRLLSTINAYPSYVIPGDVESRYVAALGEDTMAFLSGVLDRTKKKKRIKLALVAATSISSNAGICGNDSRHNRLKRTLLENCPACVVFEGEKLLEPNGSAIFETEENWLEFAKSTKGRVKFITHVPEAFHDRPEAQQRLFHVEISRLKEIFGDRSIIVLESREPKIATSNG